MIATTKEQSDRLLKCGISEDTADIHINRHRFANAGATVNYHPTSLADYWHTV